MRSRTLTRECSIRAFGSHPPCIILTTATPYLYPRVCRGNWGVDLQAGSEFGYKLLFVVLLAGIFAIFMQVRALTSPARPANPRASLTTLAQ